MELPKKTLILTGILILFCSNVVSQQLTILQKQYSLFNQLIETGQRNRLPAMEKIVIPLHNLAAKDSNDNLLALSNFILGAIKVEQFRPDLAMQYLPNAVFLCEKVFGKNAEQTMKATAYLSWAHGYMYNFELEKKYSYELLSFYKTNEKKYVVEIADLYNTIGLDYGYLGNRISEQQFINMGKSLLDNFHPTNDTVKQLTLINIYNSLSLSYLASGNIEDAMSYAKRCLSMREKYIPGSDEQNISKMVIGKCFFEKDRDIDSALFYLNQAIESLEVIYPDGQTRKGGPQWISYKSYIVDILIKSGQLNEAINYSRNTINYVKKTQTLDPVTVESLIKNYLSLSDAYVTNNEYAKAIKINQEAQEIISSVGGVRPLLIAFMNAQYATALVGTKNFALARKKFESAISATGISWDTLMKSNFNIPIAVPKDFLFIYKLAGSFLVQNGIQNKNKGDVISGINILEKVVTAYGNQITWLFDAGVNEAQGLQDISVYEDLLNALYSAHDYMDKKVILSKAFSTIEASKATLLKSTLLIENKMSKLFPPEENRKRIELKTKLFAAKSDVGKTGTKDSQQKLIDLRSEYMEYLSALKRKYSFNDMKQIEKISSDDRLLTNFNGTIINYFLGSKNLYMFIIENGEQKFIKKIIPPTFAKDIVFVKKSGLSLMALSDPTNLANMERISKQWYSWLLGDVNPGKELVIIPHRQLSSISFEMLDANPIAGDPHYTINKFPIRYELSASLMFAQNENHKVENTVFAGFSASNFKKPYNNSTNILEGTDEEVKSISELMKGKVYLNTTPSTFLSNIDECNIIHVATHAFADRGPNHECNFVFEEDSSGNNTVQDAEIAGLRLDADMTVLSACNTGIGVMNNSEGMLSLGRSFFLAGCPAVVMSLWTVNDASTKKIMLSFYRHLSKGESKSVALQNAKLDYLNTETNPAKRHPYYWAGFIVVGNNEPLVQFKNIFFSANNFLILVGIASLILLFYWRKKVKSSAA